MKKHHHPHYRLSVNKAVDRYLLVELIRFAEKMQYIDMRNADYFSLGGPFLIDHRIIHSYFPNTKLHSIEDDKVTYMRQDRHVFCNIIELINKDVSEYINEHSFDNPAVFWLDYTCITKQYLDTLANLALKLPVGSIVKITFNASPPYKPVDEITGTEVNKFRSKFNDYITDLSPEQITDSDKYCFLLYNMVICAIAKLQKERVIPGFFVPCDFITYSDTSPMMSISGIITRKEQIEELKKQLQEYDFFSPNGPQLINMPDLSIIERHFINRKLPTDSIDDLLNTLGYPLQRNEKVPFAETKKLLKIYAKFWHKYPEFIQTLIP